MCRLQGPYLVNADYWCSYITRTWKHGFKPSFWHQIHVHYFQFTSCNCENELFLALGQNLVVILDGFTSWSKCWLDFSPLRVVNKRYSASNLLTWTHKMSLDTFVRFYIHFLWTKFHFMSSVFFLLFLGEIKHLPGRLLTIQIIVEIGKSNNYELRSSVFRK